MKTLLILLCLSINLIAEEEAREIDAVVSLETKAEKTEFKETGRYEEVAKLCKAFVKAYPEKVKCHSFGKTPEGREMLSLVVSGDGTLEPETAKAKNKPVLFFQGGIHAGEIDGKDAGFLYLKELLRGEINDSPLKQTVMVFVPVFNIDGHERFGKNQRPNQRGPEETGWRTTAQNYNLNRDYLKADAPEMQAMISYLNEWDPIVYVDLHVTDGADFQPEISVMINPALKGEEPLHPLAKSFSDSVIKKMNAKGHLTLDFYPSFVKDDEPETGFELGVAPPRFSQSYWGARNRIGILVETHSWKEYPVRVKATRDVLEFIAEETALKGATWKTAAAKLDETSKKRGGSEVVLTYEATKKSKTIDFAGYRYERTASPISGQLVTKYFPKEPVVWKVPFFDEVVPKLTVYAPKGGYLISPAFQDMVEKKLKIHGLEYKVLTNPLSQAAVERFSPKEFEFGKSSYEGHMTLKLTGKWELARENLQKGTLFVPISQSKSRLVLHLFEPEAPDSLLSWGFFNTAFEKKEYMEAYVIDVAAKEMLAQDAALKAEFEAKLKSDPVFEKDPDKRFEFFHKRHPSWDTRFGVYPVLKSATLDFK